MKKIYINFNDLDEDTQDYLIEKSEENISSEKREELKELSKNIDTKYEELLRTEAEENLSQLDIEFNI